MRGGGAGSRFFQTHLLDTSGKREMYSEKNNVLRARVKNRDWKEKWLGSCVVRRGKRECGVGCGMAGEALKTLNIYFCLC